MKYQLHVAIPVNGKVGKAQVRVCKKEGGQLALAPDEADLRTLEKRESWTRRTARRLSLVEKDEVREFQDDLERAYLGAYGVYEKHCEAAASREAAAAEAGQDAPAEDVDERAARLLAEMPADLQRSAKALLRRKHLLKSIIDDVEALGVAGERELAGTLYLAGVSRLLAQPLAVRVKGPSSSGKSYVIDRVARLFPPEAVVQATQMTPQALFHMPAGSLVNVWIVAGERSRLDDDEVAEATRALREMLSAGKLSKLMPVKVGGGQIVTQQITQDGPVAYVESTTMNVVFDEDENRCLSVFTNEQSGQTRLILDRLGAALSQGDSGADVARIIGVHHALQRSLVRRKILIPFGAKLAELFPEKRVEARRAFQLLLSMVQACALLHQHQRRVDDGGRVIAERDDYRLAAAMLEKPLARLLGGGLPDAARRFHVRLKTWFAQGEFTPTDAKLKEEASPSSVKGWLRELTKAGIVEEVSEHRGNQAAKLRVREMTIPDQKAALPSEADVFERLG